MRSFQIITFLSLYNILMLLHSILIKFPLKSFCNRLTILFRIHPYFRSYKNWLPIRFLIPNYLCSLALSFCPPTLTLIFTLTILYIKCCPSINKQFRLDSFLDREGHHSIFISILQTTASDSLLRLKI